MSDLFENPMGLDGFEFIEFKVERQKIDSADSFGKKNRSYPEVYNFVKLSGSIDYQITVWVEDINALSNFIDNRLLALDGVVDANSAIVLENFPCAPYQKSDPSL